jgi:hypothetical protein
MPCPISAGGVGNEEEEKTRPDSKAAVVERITDRRTHHHHFSRRIRIHGQRKRPPCLAILADGWLREAIRSDIPPNVYLHNQGALSAITNEEAEGKMNE